MDVIFIIYFTNSRIKLCFPIISLLGKVGLRGLGNVKQGQSETGQSEIPFYLSFKSYTG